MSSPDAVAVFGSSLTSPRSTDWADAERVGTDLAQAGLAVMTGGYGGTMEAVSRGASRAGGHVIGVTAPQLFPGRQSANPYVVELIEATGLAERIGTMIARAVGAIALPGSIGTATELLIAWDTNHIVRHNGGSRLPTVAVGDGWASVARTLSDEIGAVLDDIHLAPTTNEALAWLLDHLEIR